MTRQNKLQDPTEAAMSAIEEALRLDQPRQQQDGDDTAEPKLPSATRDDLNLDLRRDIAPPESAAKAERASPPPPRPAIAPDASRVANDDRRDSSTLVQAFSVRPSTRPTWIAALASLDPPNLGAVGPRVYGDGIRASRLLTVDFVHRTHLDIFPTYYPPVFTDWWLDDWISRVYGRTRTTRGPFSVLHHTGHSGTRYHVNRENERALVAEVERGQARIKMWLDLLASLRSERTFSRFKGAVRANAKS